MNDKIQVRYVVVVRAEGPHDECDKPKAFFNYKEANNCLRKWALTAPDTGGYDKCDFIVIFRDGITYSGRFDLQRKHADRDYLLQKHMKEFLGYRAGLECPDHMTVPEYLKYINLDGGEQRDEALRTLELYDLEGVKAF